MRRGCRAAAPEHDADERQVIGKSQVTFDFPCIRPAVGTLDEVKIPPHNTRFYGRRIVVNWNVRLRRRTSTAELLVPTTIGSER